MVIPPPTLPPAGHNFMTADEMRDHEIALALDRELNQREQPFETPLEKLVAHGYLPKPKLTIFAFL